MICPLPLSIFMLFLTSLSITTATIHPTVYIIRHGEQSGDPDDHGLGPVGVKRAQCLRHVFGAGSPYNIGYIAAPKVKWNGDHRRPYETVLPLATDLGLTVDTSCKRNQPKCVKKLVKHYKDSGNILVSWRHGKLREIAMELGNRDPPEYPEDR
ncbi:hypothetical protein PHISCL_03101 [Aspergillus sclerotialis]|uniref:Phosphoglycerate mutase family protein n=1 Tax=Aspergillus sclerotialis TaxID=2070753 RepID=A0A3A2ZPG0_9EURO|nr:hypothetical protein PHISCL_03101 [Aspergillus sclerotialis]